MEFELMQKCCKSTIFISDFRTDFLKFPFVKGKATTGV